MEKPVVLKDLFELWKDFDHIVERLFFLFVVWFAWIVHVWYNEDDKLVALALLASLCFMVIETAWTSLWEDGHFSPHWIGHTTWVQFWGNVLYTPVLLVLYPKVLETVDLRSAVPNEVANWLETPMHKYILFFPINVWLLELVQGYSFIMLFGRNPAWFYTEKDALFHGNIRIGMCVQWWALGALAWFLQQYKVTEWGATFLRENDLDNAIFFSAFTLSMISEPFLGWPKIALPSPSPPIPQEEKDE